MSVAKHASSPRTAANARASANAHLSTRVALARCERADGLIRREQCKWRICDGRWGKDGCPSYARQKLVYD